MKFCVFKMSRVRIKYQYYGGIDNWALSDEERLWWMTIYYDNSSYLIHKPYSVSLPEWKALINGSYELKVGDTSIVNDGAYITFDSWSYPLGLRAFRIPSHLFIPILEEALKELEDMCWRFDRGSVKLSTLFGAMKGLRI